MSIRKKINRLIIRLIVPILLLMNLGCDSVPEEGDTVIAWVYAIEDTKEGRFLRAICSISYEQSQLFLVPLPEGVSVPEDGLIEIEVGKKDLTNWFDSSEKVENGYSKFIRHIDVEHLSWPTHTGHRTTPVCKPKGRSWEKSRRDRKK